jgi:hypothetical protein
MKRKNDFLLQYVGGQAIVVPLGSKVVDMNGLVTLNTTGAFLWDLLAEDSSIEALGARVAEHFDVDVDRAVSDVQAFVDKFTRMGLLES